MKLNINILNKMIFSFLTFFIIFVNYMLIKILWKHGFDETAFWLIPTISLLIFFSYFTFKLFTRKKDTRNKIINKWSRTLKTTTTGVIVFSSIIGLIILIMHMHLSSYKVGNMPEGLNFSYAIGISFLSLLFAFILIVMISISFYKDIKTYKK